MEVFRKAANVQGTLQLDEAELELINRQTLRPLAADEVFVFRLAACDNQVDRDNERFTDEALEQMVPLYVGRPVLMDHKWSSKAQTARVYAAGVESKGEYKSLVLRCYMPRTDGTAESIAAIESGVLRECSVGLCISKAVCSICGVDQMDRCCQHRPGATYDGKKCHIDLGDVRDVYEVSMVAVPAQPNAGVVKSKRYGGTDATPAADGQDKQIAKARARLALEKIRFGG